MSGGRTVRNPPLSHVLTIYEGTTPSINNIIGAKSEDKQKQIGDNLWATHPHIQPPATIASLSPQTPPVVPLLFVLSVRQDQANRQACQARAQPQQFAVSTSVAPLAPMPNANATTTMTRRLTAVIASFVFVIMVMTTLH